MCFVIKVCEEYSQLIYSRIKDPVLILNGDGYVKVKDCYDVKTLIVGGIKAEPKEFPHMVIFNNLHDNCCVYLFIYVTFLGFTGLW